MDISSGGIQDCVLRGLPLDALKRDALTEWKCGVNMLQDESITETQEERSEKKRRKNAFYRVLCTNLDGTNPSASRNQVHLRRTRERESTVYIHER